MRISHDGYLGIGTPTPNSLFQTAGTQTFSVESDGRIWGTAIHNNASSVSGTTKQYICSGTYTPALSNITDITSSSANECQWLRVGNVVTVCGSVNVTPTTDATLSEIDMTLPIASTFTGGDCIGTIFFNDTSTGADLGDNGILDASTKAKINFRSDFGLHSGKIYFHYTYQIK